MPYLFLLSMVFWRGFMFGMETSRRDAEVINLDEYRRKRQA
jgi:hypothetical protein